MTLTEYENVSKKKRLQYRLYRNPVVMIGLSALFMFLLRNRLPTRTVKRKERMSVLFINLLIVVVILVASRFIGWRTYLLARGGGGNLAVLCATSVPRGVSGTQKRVGAPARRYGRQFILQMPAVLRWFSSNIGYHHVHHLSPRIPILQPEEV